MAPWAAPGAAVAPSSMFSLLVALGVVQQDIVITSFEIFRQPGKDQMGDTFQLFVSDDATNWTDQGVFSFDRQIDDGQFYDITSHPKARYFKFVRLSGPKNFILVGEITV